MKNAVGFYFIVLYLFFVFLSVFFNKKALHYCERTVEVIITCGRGQRSPKNVIFSIFIDLLKFELINFH